VMRSAGSLVSMRRTQVLGLLRDGRPGGRDRLKLPSLMASKMPSLLGAQKGGSPERRMYSTTPAPATHHQAPGSSVVLYYSTVLYCEALALAYRLRVNCAICMDLECHLSYCTHRKSKERLSGDCGLPWALPALQMSASGP